jgi:putative PIG3 family NAD(P)H quinone oxidoreductase
LPGGGYAEYALTHQDHALPAPAGMGMVEAAALCETLFTVWTNVFGRGRLQAGESFLVHGGSSGIGTTAIQLARLRGARVFATAGSEAKCQACRELGAELAVNYREADYVAAVREATRGRGVDVILDMVGGDYLPRDVRALALEGRLVMIGFLAGPQAELNFAQVMVKRLTLTGSTLRPQSVEAKARIAADLRREVWPLIEAGRMSPVMDRTYPLEAAAEAHARMESSAHIGKIVLTVA